MAHPEAEMHSQENSDASDEEYDDICYADYDFDYPDLLAASDPGPSRKDRDPEYFEYDCLLIIEVERLLNEAVAALCEKVPVTPALAKVLLHNNQWQLDDIIKRYNDNYNMLLVDTRLKPKPGKTLRASSSNSGKEVSCAVCTRSVTKDRMRALSCMHDFCIECWQNHVVTQLSNGTSTGIECMESECRILAPEDFVLDLLEAPEARARYQQFAFQDHVKSHPELRFCPGSNCPAVIRARKPGALRCVCKMCSVSICFQCTLDYHAPTTCDTIKQWLMKCADDSETANYITAHTKDCPKCHICIEKNGGCNHMQCWKCKHHFCWMCLGDWKAHGTEYYECSKYKENPNIATEAVHVKAREALQKYLHYFERWENHNKSLKLEEQMLERIKGRIEDKINKKEGTWIDWQYLYDAAALLTKCRYTLQYTYPYAYFMEPGPRKELFEYQQGQLEAEIENLSWKVERAESHDRGDLEKQMHIAERKRLTLLKDFLP